MKVEACACALSKYIYFKGWKFKTSQCFKSIAFAVSTILSDKTYRLENETLFIPLIFLLVYKIQKSKQKLKKPFAKHTLGYFKIKMTVCEKEYKVNYSVI